jgi:hypothetical protein
LDPTRRPGKIRVGDINIDGYPDLLMTVYQAGNSEKTGQAVLVICQGLTNNLPTYAFNSEYGNIENSEGYVSMTSYNTMYASFFDFDELGYIVNELI